MRSGPSAPRPVTNSGLSLPQSCGVDMNAISPHHCVVTKSDIRHLRAHLDVYSSGGLLAGGLPLEDGLPVSVQLQVGDDNVGGVDTDLDGGAVGLVGGDSLDVDDPLLTVDLRMERETMFSDMRVAAFNPTT